MGFNIQVITHGFLCLIFCTGKDTPGRGKEKHQWGQLELGMSMGGLGFAAREGLGISLVYQTFTV